jgi:hypothetical protein
MQRLKFIILSGTLIISLLALIGCGGGSATSTSSGSTPPVTTPPGPPNPSPSLTSLTPATAIAGNGGVTVTINGTGFLSGSDVTWVNGALSMPLLNTFVSATELSIQVPASLLGALGTATITVTNPSPGGGTSNKLSFAITLPPGVSVVNINANYLAWDPVNQVIYLSLPSTDGANGNSVQVLDPQTGTLGAASFAGSEPDLLSVSANSEYLYVSQAGASTVERLTLPDLMTDSTIQLGSASFFGPFIAMDLQAAPNADGTVAVGRGTPGTSPEQEGGVVIYDNGAARPNTLCGFIQSGCMGTSGLYDSIQWNSDATEMFAANYEDTGFDFYTAPINSSGFGTVTDYSDLVPGFFEFIHYDATTNRVYDDDGVIIDPASGTVVGTFAASGLMVPDGKLGVAFFLGQSQQQIGTQNFTLESF